MLMKTRQAGDNYQALHRAFRWQVPPRFNIAQACCGRWAAQPDAAQRVAIRAHAVDAPTRTLSYQALQEGANRASGLLRSLGVRRGDRVAIVMPQRFETAIAYMAVFQLGAVAMPLSMLFGPDALGYRLQDSGAVVAICDESSIANLMQVRAECPALRQVVGVGISASGVDLAWEETLPHHSAVFEPEATRPDEGAILIYTSGTTGPPKGAFLPHRALIGNLPGFVCSQNWFGFDPVAGQTSPASPARLGKGPKQAPPPLPEPATPSVFWSPADWAWTGGLMDALLPTLYFGRVIVAFNGRFSPQLAFSLMQEQGVTHSFLFPTALKAMMKAYPEPSRQFRLQLQAMMSAGEAVGDAVFDYCREQLGVVVNEMFGQTEINYVVGNCTHPSVGWPARPGSMGKGYPGHRVAVIDGDGSECPVGVPGDVALNRYDIHGEPDPIFFLGYWKNDDATRAKYSGDWCRTGDLATRDADGYLWYQGRADDVFKAAGYRIGPSEIENCLVKHPAVANAAVVPKPDRERGALVKAFVVLAPDYVTTRALARDRARFEADLIVQLQLHVKDKLAPYEYPKEIEFIEALPMTTTGKVQRRVLRLREEEKARALPS
jgi:acetyl-CoA synthetase